MTAVDEARRRMLEALADGLRRQWPGSLIELVADEHDVDAVLDRPAASADDDAHDTGADGA